MAKIMLIEDEQALADTIAFNLTAEGYSVVTVADGMEALTAIRREQPDLLLLDIMLPGIDGLEICRILRHRLENLPIILLTAKSSEVDKVLGLNVGADDYITKPFSMMELLARVRAALRRAQQPHNAGDILRGEGVVLDLARHQVTVQGTAVELRPKEFELLRILLASAGKVVSRSALFDTVWGDVDYYDQGTLDVHIRRLREKIETNPGNPTRILTVRGVGYKFSG